MKKSQVYISIKGDLLKLSQLDIVVQQTNCISKYGKGLAEQISKELKVDLYKFRQQPDIPGSMNISKSYLKQGMSNPRFVASLFAQYAPGKGRGQPYYDKNKKIIDDQSNRIWWFSQGLEELGEYIEEYNDNHEDTPIKCVGFPFQIGCGLAGGDWSIYEEMVNNFADKHKNQFLTYLVTYSAQQNYPNQYNPRVSYNNNNKNGNNGYINSNNNNKNSNYSNINANQNGFQQQQSNQNGQNQVQDVEEQLSIVPNQERVQQYNQQQVQQQQQNGFQQQQKQQNEGFQQQQNQQQQSKKQKKTPPPSNQPKIYQFFKPKN